MITHEAGFAVLYIYEIHLAVEARGHGLGRRFMQIAEAIARNIGPGIEKVMLTCFLSNVAAQAFYQKLGYERDECSPETRETRGKLVQPDYVILSKRLHERNAEACSNDRP
jgi:ribosomal protein S18 acetylase RimI-like enzyme